MNYLAWCHGNSPAWHVVVHISPSLLWNSFYFARPGNFPCLERCCLARLSCEAPYVAALRLCWVSSFLRSSQWTKCGLAASTSPGDLLERLHLGPMPGLVNQNLHFIQIPGSSRTLCSGRSSTTEKCSGAALQQYRDLWSFLPQSIHLLH